MAVGDGVVWNESLPDNSTLAHQIDDYNRDLRVGVVYRLRPHTPAPHVISILIIQPISNQSGCLSRGVRPDHMPDPRYHLAECSVHKLAPCNR